MAAGTRGARIAAAGSGMARTMDASPAPSAPIASATHPVALKRRDFMSTVIGQPPPRLTGRSGSVQVIHARAAPDAPGIRRRAFPLVGSGDWAGCRRVADDNLNAAG